MKYLHPLLFVVFILVSCKKDDNPPSVTILGKNPDSVYVKTSAEYNDPGATANDPEDGPVELIIAKNVNMQVAGHYLIFYSAKDKYDNVSEKVERHVYVIKADGEFTAVESCSASGTQNLLVTATSNFNNDTISLKDFPVASFTTKAVVKEGGYRIFQQDINGVVSIEGDIQADHTDLVINYTRTSLVGPPATENCSLTLKRNN
jgi:hypothetical protein